MQWLSKALTKGPDLKADILDAGVELKGSKLAWKIHEAKRKDNGSPASVLAFEITAATSDVEIACARNALHRFKTIRHPHVLLYLDGFEPPEGSKTGKILIVVEHVKPLEQPRHRWVTSGTFYIESSGRQGRRIIVLLLFVEL